MLWNTEAACECKNHSPVQNQGVAALSAGDSDVQPSGDTGGKTNAAGNLSKQEVGHMQRAICTLFHKSFPVFLFLIIILFNDAAPSGKKDLNRILFLKQIKFINPWNEGKNLQFLKLYYISPLQTLTLYIEFLTSYFLLFF